MYLARIYIFPISLGEEARERAPCRRQGHLRGLPSHHAGSMQILDNHSVYKGTRQETIQVTVRQIKLLLCGALSSYMQCIILFPSIIAGL